MQIPSAIWLEQKRADTVSSTAAATTARQRARGALRRDRQLIWTTQQRPTTRDDVIPFLDQIAAQPHPVPRIVLNDNAGIYKDEVLDKDGASGLGADIIYSICRLIVQTSTASGSCRSMPSFTGAAALRRTGRSGRRELGLDERFRKYIQNKFCAVT